MNNLASRTHPETPERLRYGVMWLEMQEKWRWENPLKWLPYPVTNDTLELRIWERGEWN